MTDIVKMRFYRDPKSFINKMICKWTHGPFYHCALVVNGVVYSSSLTYGGTYAIPAVSEEFDSNFDTVDMPWALADAVMFYYNETKGQPYNTLDLVLDQVFNMNIDSKKSSFCSEWCGEALGIPRADIYNPNSLYDLITFLNTMENKDGNNRNLLAKA